ncbi:MAG: hypothetical protein AB7T49_03035 [Oligoflexales bacterium]
MNETSLAANLGPQVIGAPFEPKQNVEIQRQVVINVVSGHDPKPNFWVGFCRSGNTSPIDLYDVPIEEVFERVSVDGLAENDAVMLVDSTGRQSKYLYLLNVSSMPLENDLDKALNRLVDVLTLWKTKQVGIYLAPTLIPSSAWQQMFTRVLESLVSNLEIEEYFLLTGTLGLNAVVNAAVQVKESLIAMGTKINLFH